MSGTVSSGPNQIDSANVEGSSIRQVMDNYKSILNIPDGAKVLLNGNETTNLSHTISSDDDVEFVKKAGTKG